MVWRRIAMGVVAAVVIAGCGAAEPSSVSIDSATSDVNQPARDSAPTDSWSMTYDEQFMLIAEEVPAFAGLWRPHASVRSRRPTPGVNCSSGISA